MVCYIADAPREKMRLMAKTVLIIDDDPVICQVIENILYLFGYKVLTAASTFGGLVYLQPQQHIDLIL